MAVLVANLPCNQRWLLVSWFQGGQGQLQSEPLLGGSVKAGILNMRSPMSATDVPTNGTEEGSNAAPMGGANEI